MNSFSLIMKKRFDKLYYQMANEFGDNAIDNVFNEPAYKKYEVKGKEYFTKWAEMNSDQFILNYDKDHKYVESIRSKKG